MIGLSIMPVVASLFLLSPLAARLVREELHRITTWKAVMLYVTACNNAVSHFANLPGLRSMRAKVRDDRHMRISGEGVLTHYILFAICYSRGSECTSRPPLFPWILTRNFTRV